MTRSECDRRQGAHGDMALSFNPDGGQFIVGESSTELLFRPISVACLGIPAGGATVMSFLPMGSCHTTPMALPGWSPRLVALPYDSILDDPEMSGNWALQQWENGWFLGHRTNIDISCLPDKGARGALPECAAWGW